MRCRILAPSLDEVGPVQSGRVDPHPDVIFADLRLGNFADGDDLGTSRAFVYHCPHDGFSLKMIGSKKMKQPIANSQ
jgi:hypothetical protein